jgi:hypothetical protein
MARPEPREMPEGCHAEAVPDGGWRLVIGKRCRFVVGPGHRACGRPSVAEFNRGRYIRAGRGDSWWAYCDEHLYGRWIEDGRVMNWIAVENDG